MILRTSTSALSLVREPHQTASEIVLFAQWIPGKRPDGITAAVVRSDRIRTGLALVENQALDAGYQGFHQT